MWIAESQKWDPVHRKKKIKNIGVLNGNHVELIQSINNSITSIDVLLKFALILQIIYVPVQFCENLHKIRESLAIKIAESTICQWMV